MLVARAQTDDVVETRHRQMPGHERDDAVIELAIGNADGIAGEALQHLQARQRVGGFGPHRALDQVERWNELRHGGHYNLPAPTLQPTYSMPIWLRSRQSSAAFSARARSALESLATILSRLASATPPALAIRCHLAASTTFISTPAPWA